MAGSEAVKEYASSLEDLTTNSKPMINMLTMLAEDNVDYAPNIVDVIVQRVSEVPPSNKLSLLYLIDSILKNLHDSPYTELFGNVIVNVFTSIFEQVDEKARQALFKVRQTWKEIISNRRLYAVDVRTNRIDHAWPITASAPSTKPANVHLNPKFMKSSTATSVAESSLALSTSASVATSSFSDGAIIAVKEETPTEDEAQLRSHLLEQQAELIRLQKQKLEYEVAQAKAKLEQQNQELRLREQVFQQMVSSTIPAIKPEPVRTEVKPLMETRDPRLIHSRFDNSAEAPQVLKVQPVIKPESRPSPTKPSISQADNPISVEVKLESSEPSATLSPAERRKNISDFKIPKRDRSPCKASKTTVPPPSKAPERKLISAKVPPNKLVPSKGSDRKLISAKSLDKKLISAKVSDHSLTSAKAPKEKSQEKKEDAISSKTSNGKEDAAQSDTSTEPPKKEHVKIESKSRTDEDKKESSNDKTEKTVKSDSSKARKSRSSDSLKTEDKKSNVKEESKSSVSKSGSKSEGERRRSSPRKRSRSRSPKSRDDHSLRDSRRGSKKSHSEKDRSDKYGHRESKRPDERRNSDEKRTKGSSEKRRSSERDVFTIPKKTRREEERSRDASERKRQNSSKPVEKISSNLMSSRYRQSEGRTNYPREAEMKPDFQPKSQERRKKTLLPNPDMPHAFSDVGEELPAREGEHHNLIVQARRRLHDGLINDGQFNEIVEQVSKLRKLQQMREKLRDEPMDVDTNRRDGEADYRWKEQDSMGRENVADYRGDHSANENRDRLRRDPRKRPKAHPAPEIPPKRKTLLPAPDVPIPGPEPTMQGTDVPHHHRSNDQHIRPMDARMPKPQAPIRHDDHAFRMPGSRAPAPRPEFRHVPSNDNRPRMKGPGIHRPHQGQVNQPGGDLPFQLAPPSSRLATLSLEVLSLPLAKDRRLSKVIEDATYPHISFKLFVNNMPYEIPMGFHPRTYKIYHVTRTIRLDRETKMCLIDGEPVYRIGEKIKLIKLDKRRVEVFVTGPKRMIWIDGVLLNVRADAPPLNVKLRGRDHDLQIDGFDNVLYIDGENCGPADGGPRNVNLRGDSHVVQFYAPAKEITVDGKVCEVNFSKLIPYVEIDGQRRGICFEGPPRHVVIDDIPYMVPLDAAVLLHIPGQKRPVQIAFGGPGHELIIDGQFHELQFNSEPKEFECGRCKRMIHLPGKAPNVKLLEVIPDNANSVHFWRHHLNLSRERQRQRYSDVPSGPSHPVHVGMRPGQFPENRPVQSNQSHSAPIQTHQGHAPAPNIQSSAPTQAPKGQDVSSLFNDLVRYGIITEGPANPGSSGEANKESSVKESKEGPKDVPTEEKEAIREPLVPDLTSWKFGRLEARYPKVIRELFEGIQCSNCGIRFRERGSRYKEHLDWHFRQNQRLNSSKAVPCRSWFYDMPHWIQYAEVADSTEDSRGNIFEMEAKSNVKEEKAAINVKEDEGEKENLNYNPVVVNSDEKAKCQVCGENFEHYWDADEDDWRLKDAVSSNNKLYHPVCYEDAKHQPPSGSVTPVHEPESNPMAAAVEPRTPEINPILDPVAYITKLTKMSVKSSQDKATVKEEVKLESNKSEDGSQSNDTVKSEDPHSELKVEAKDTDA